MDAVRLVRDWLDSVLDAPVATRFEGGEAFPRVVVFDSNGAPRRDGQSQSAISDATVSVYVVGGLTDNGNGDLPDYPKAWTAADQLEQAIQDFPVGRGWVSPTGHRLTYVAIATGGGRSTDSATNEARVTFTLSIRVTRAA